MGRIGVPFGVKGFVKVFPATARVDGLAGYATWWLGRDGQWRDVRVESAKAHGASLVAKLAGVDDRDAAAGLRGLDIAVPRDAFPRAATNEYYHADLVGLRVVNGATEVLGTVTGIMETGANDVLVVRDGGGEGGDARERLVPFIANVVKDVNLASGVITVDWGLDY